MLEHLWDKAGRVSRRLVPLGEPELVARACRETQLNDLGDGTFREPLRILLESYDREASLSLLGRILVRQDTFATWGPSSSPTIMPGISTRRISVR